MPNYFAIMQARRTAMMSMTDLLNLRFLPLELLDASKPATDLARRFYAQPDWPIDRKNLASRFPPRVRAVDTGSCFGVRLTPWGTHEHDFPCSSAEYATTRAAVASAHPQCAGVLPDGGWELEHDGRYLAWVFWSAAEPMYT